MCVELLYADDLTLMRRLRDLGISSEEKKEALGSEGLKVNVGKTKVLVSGSITQDGLSTSIVDPCGVCSLRVKANSVLCVQCGKWIHGRFAGVKRVTPKY